ncbi:ethanolamine ammonia-lyase subunit EutC [Noviherbaspirillum saxi]|uniref:Ethanolamine ammonia-lyase small subunit n=1 Tax=Noviherbaspirillum saxi TaxID=2320863 RepID=A0A3A3FI39_9BURK|nr:ethanolamine ammonia-lyase subunit EutC [Noviherbaspirillum saxi]RJF92058.1 ethanolamine ammonia-lyase subunit EutC [Noviherbaspirillum saxi]
MNHDTIDDIVQAVIAEISRDNAAAAATSPSSPSSPSSVTEDERDALPDLSGETFRRRVSVPHPHKPEVLQDLVNSTGARVAVGRAGPRPRTTSVLRFLADHSRSKDTVLKDFPMSWVEESKLLELRTEIIEKDQFLTRPDLGRRLCKESVQLAISRCKPQPQVQVMVSDGLSTDAVVVNFDEIIPPLLKGLENAGLDVGTPVFVRHGRVKVQDHLGEILGAKVVILLIGERPGLGQSESLSCYMVYGPTVEKTVESDRICISNIHAAGTPPIEAAAVIVDLAKKFLRDGKSAGATR